MQDVPEAAAVTFWEQRREIDKIFFFFWLWSWLCLWPNDCWFLLLLWVIVNWDGDNTDIKLLVLGDRKLKKKFMSCLSFQLELSCQGELDRHLKYRLCCFGYIYEVINPVSLCFPRLYFFHWDIQELVQN